MKIKFEVHESDSGIKVLYFAVGLIIRFDLYRIQNGQGSLLGPTFERMARAYRDSVLDLSVNRLRVVKIPSLSGVNSLAVRIRFNELSGVRVIINGYEISLITDKRGISNPAFDFISEKQTLVAIDDSAKNPSLIKVATAVTESANKRPR